MNDEFVKLDQKINQLIASYNEIKRENALLCEKLTESEDRINGFKERLDKLLERLDSVEGL
ncbi:MAG: hypothetical protein FWD70_07505 [Desulfuromonadales bacterium]|jgi:predicted nuclease with TOPRIM domain|nr:hypothetical protein [Desulfuromonadales bacterium]